ncbi:MAG: hypothetical protein SFX18_03500 [Pirellulales bacterium]|nr:hypothetical protein [Pirellulales bacterium]
MPTRLTPRIRHFETLEDRYAMVGDVVAGVVNGTLLLFDGDENVSFRVSQWGDGSIRVSGAPGTTINGSFYAQTFSGVTAISAILGSGHDSIVFHNLTIPGAIQAYLGAGDDNITLRGVSAQSLLIEAGNGQDEIEIGYQTPLNDPNPVLFSQFNNFALGLQIDAGAEFDVINLGYTNVLAGELLIEGGAGTSYIKLYNVYAGGEVTLLPGSDDGFTQIGYLNAQKSLTIYDDTGNDLVSMFASAVQQSTQVTDNFGSDTIALAVFVSPKIWIDSDHNGGTGTDFVNLDNVINQTELRIRQGMGSNMTQISGSNLGAARLEGNNYHVDKLKIIGSTLQSLYADFGNGNDEFWLENSTIAHTLKLYGGLGWDKLVWKNSMYLSQLLTMSGFESQFYI